MPNPAPSSGSPGCLNPFSSKPAIVLFISGTHRALRDSHMDLCSQQPAEPTKNPATSKNAPKVSPPPSLPAADPGTRSLIPHQWLRLGECGNKSRGNECCWDCLPRTGFVQQPGEAEMFSELTGLQLLNCFE